MKFCLNIRSVMIIKISKVEQADDVELSRRTVVKSVDNEIYRYLGYRKKAN